jgi:DNA replication licensing factor MCM6
MREQKTARIGRLISLSGTVTRSTEVRPELIEGAFDCKLCGTLVKGITQQFKFTEPQFCTNSVCDNRTKWELNLSESVFVDWQKYRVQENAQDIPPGSMPRSIDVVVRNEIVDAAKPGDRAIFTGNNLQTILSKD